MPCPKIERSDVRDKTGAIKQYTYRLIKSFDEASVKKVKKSERSKFLLKPRSVAFAVITILNFNTETERKLTNILGTALNMDEQPQEFQDLFGPDGSLLEENRGKIAYVSFLNREQKDLTKDKDEGTFVKNSNLPKMFGKTSEEVYKNDVLKKYYADYKDPSKRSFTLAKGSASELMNCLLGPESPLLQLGVQYILLHAASYNLETEYYEKVLHFTPLRGIPLGKAYSIIYDNENPSQKELNVFIDLFRDMEPVENKRGGDELRKIEPYFVRMINGVPYATYENDDAGAMLYKKIDGRPKSLRYTRRSKPLSIGAKKYIEKELLGSLKSIRTNTRKIHTPRKTPYSTQSMKRN